MLGNKRFYVIIFFAVFLLTGCGEKIEPGNVESSKKEHVKAPVVSAKIISQPFFYESVGTVSSKIVSTISSKLMGSVRDVLVREGDQVKKGDLLANIDNRQVSAMFRQAKAALAEARRAETAASAGAELAIATYTRYQNLMKDESTSPQEFDEIKSRYQQAQAGLAAAKQRVKQAQAGLSSALVSAKDAVILAPYDGTIRAKLIDVGDLAAPGKPLFTLETTGNYIVELMLPEQYIHSVGLNQEVTVTVSALDNKTITGNVSEIFPAADAKSRSFLIKVKIPVDKALRSGMFARVSIPIGKAGLMLIPATAVIHSGQLTGLYVVDDTQTARFRLIRTGRIFGESIEVLSGIKDGERYVSVPPPNLNNGMTVEAVS
ncbi:MAG: efflux RND transporter periplasmic adaptor subunit [Desulfobacterales bacterium]